jgi:thioredoxin reductase
MTQHYNLIVIGAGSGGLAAAKNAASLGANVASLWRLKWAQLKKISIIRWQSIPPMLKKWSC